MEIGDIELQNVLRDLEDNALTAILWFENNYMKLNQSKCHFLTSGSTEHLWVTVGNEMIWESQSEKLLGMSVDKDLNFNSHLKSLIIRSSYGLKWQKCFWNLRRNK